MASDFFHQPFSVHNNDRKRRKNWRERKKTQPVHLIKVLFPFADTAAIQDYMDTRHFGHDLTVQLLQKN